MAWNRQTFVQWLLGGLLAATVTIGLAVWDNYRGKLETLQSKYEVRCDAVEALRIENRALKTELSILEKSNADCKDENKSLSWRIRRLERER